MISCVIPTVGRPELLRAVESVLCQENAPPFEVIVVVDRPEPLAPAPWQKDPRVALYQTGGLERCVARNTGAALARYPFLHFLDDDDFMLPGAYAAFGEAATRADAEEGVVCWTADSLLRRGGEESVIAARLSGNVTAVFVGGEGIQLAFCLIRRAAFWSVGGFDPASPLFEDWDLMIRLSLAGPFAPIPMTVSVVHADQPTSTTKWERWTESASHYHHKNLSKREVTRAVRSTTDLYWRGRAVRSYLSALKHLLRQGTVLRSAARITDGIYAAGGAWLSPEFRRGLRRRGGGGSGGG
jgi:GT2 family glycosyltransferase